MIFDFENPKICQKKPNKNRLNVRFKYTNYNFMVLQMEEGVCETSPKPIDLTVLTVTFHNYGIIIIDKLTLSSVTHFNLFFRPKLILT
jgi:hypothetical protein